MTEYTEYDKIINVSGLTEDVIPAGDVANWTHPEPHYSSTIETMCNDDQLEAEAALGVFANLVTIIKNNFYMDIINRVTTADGIELTDENLHEFAVGLNKAGFGKTVLLGQYRNLEFMKLVVEWCRENGFFYLFPFDMNCSLELFVDKQMVLLHHCTVC